MLNKQADGKPKNPTPDHIAIIMDGNGRWAQSRGLPRIEGHRQGAKAIRRAMEACRKQKVRYLTLYCFSSENWKRPKNELDFLMGLLRTYLIRERKNFVKNGVRLKVIGQREGLPDDILVEMDRTIQESSQGEFTLCLAINYGSRDEITTAVQQIAERAANGQLKPTDIDQALISSHLYTADIPDPDLLIRTSGEFRISNFLLWQISYTEIWISDKHWPDFQESDLLDAIQSYANRDRRFGGLSSNAQIATET